MADRPTAMLMVTSALASGKVSTRNIEYANAAICEAARQRLVNEGIQAGRMETAICL